MRVLKGLRVRIVSRENEFDWSQLDFDHDKVRDLNLRSPYAIAPQQVRPDGLRKMLKREFFKRNLDRYAWKFVTGVVVIFIGDAEEAPKLHEGDKIERNTRRIDPPGPQQFL